MRRINSAVIALALVASAIAAPARAADMPVPYYPPKAVFPPPALYNWTGIYFGGHVGGGWLNDTVTQTTTTALLTAGSVTNVSPGGFVGGGQVGANYEFAPWVIGIEGSFTASGIAGSSQIPALAAGTTESATSNVEWLANVTGRIGYAADTLLIYVKGGAAWMHAEYTQQNLIGSVVATSASLNNTRSGFVAGAGLEYGMTENFSARAEYDFYDFGTANYTFNLGGVVMPVSIKSDIHVFTVGLNYRWNWSGGWH